MINFDSERRLFPRLKISITLIYQVKKPSYVGVRIGGKEVEAQTLDLSEGGMAILTDQNILLGTAITVEFMIYEIVNKSDFRFYKEIKVIGEVASNVVLEENKRRLGIHFTYINEEDKSVIANFVKTGLHPEDDGTYFPEAP